mmetsp:Transcript_14658/g.21627  ORF Transcript_14658/g.21627 Transcript_14658/m.21627 type:complete len:572 (+) Transcript_14658:55-1770(+)
MEAKKRKADSEINSPSQSLALRSRIASTRKVARPRRDDDEQLSSFARDKNAMYNYFLQLLHTKYASIVDGDYNQSQIPFALALLQRDLKPITSAFNPEPGDVFLSGSNDSCQLGMMTECNLLKPLKNINHNFKVVQSVAAPVANFLLTNDGRLFSFGCGDMGSLGRLLEDDESEQKVAEITQFHPSKEATVKVSRSSEDGSIIQVAAGSTHRLVLTINGCVYMFGCYMDGESQQFREMPPPDVPDDDNERSQHYRGAAPRGHREYPRHLYQMPQKVQRVYAGGSMSVVKLADNTIMTWGIDACGELGQDNSEEDCKVFAKLKEAKENKKDEDLTVSEREKFKEQEANCIEVIKKKFMLPLRVVYDPPLGKHVVLDVACGGNHMLAVVSEIGNQRSVVYGTGLNQYGQLGLGHTNNVRKLTKLPESVNRDISQVAAGLFHSVFLDIWGERIWTCGRVDYGALGINDKNKPGDLETHMQLVSFDEDDRDEDLTFSSISAGEHQTFAVTKTGKLYSWGYGDTGALGHGRDEDELRPTAVKEFYGKNKLGRVTQASGGSQHVVVLAKKDQRPTEF